MQPPAIPTADQLTRYARLERRRRRPAAPDYFLPTRIGNILRAAERRPADKYGLDTITLWPHLRLPLPETTRQELRAVRASLDIALAAANLGAAVLRVHLHPPGSPHRPGRGHRGRHHRHPARAQAFGDLIEAACDLHRAVLYQQPAGPSLPTRARNAPADGS